LCTQLHRKDYYIVHIATYRGLLSVHTATYYYLCTLLHITVLCTQLHITVLCTQLHITVVCTQLTQPLQVM